MKRSTDPRGPRVAPTAVAGSAPRTLALALALSFATAAAPAPASARTYRHPSGFAFTVPAGWTTSDQAGLVRLTPPAASAQEMYFVGAQDTTGQGVTRIQDPRVLAYLDQQVRGLSAAFARVGTARLVALPRGRGVTGNQALALRWQATGRTGAQAEARAYACLVGVQGVVVLGIGAAAHLRVRALEALVRTIHASTASHYPGGGVTPGPGPGPAPTPADPGAPTGARPGPAPTPAAGGRVRHEAWDYSFRAPAGWVVRHGAEGALLGHHSIAGVILVLPHQETSAAAVRALMARGVSDAKAQLRPVGRLRALGRLTFAGVYTGHLGGQPIRARVVGAFSPHGGGGAWVFALTTPQAWSGLLVAAADATGRRLAFTRPQVTGLMRHFAGRWTAVSRHSQSSMVLAPNGQYGSSHESSYSGQFRNQYGHLTGSWGTHGRSRSAGRWTVRGTKRRGQLIVRFHNGTVRTYAYRVQVERGRTYWREYWFGGRLHSRR